MRFTADCAPCLMRRVVFQSRLEGNGREFESVKAAVDALSEGMDPDTPSVVIATDVHSRAYAALGSDDPYRRIKEEADVVAAPYERMLEDAVESSDDPLRAAIMAAVVGNIMDFGAGSAIDDPHQFMSVFDGMMSQGLGHDDTDELREELDNVAGVVYMFDNCGESQLDKILIRQLRRMGKRVVGVVRGAPILNDVTMEDALRIGMDGEVDRLLSTGKFYIGIDWDDVPGDLAEEIRSCGLIIAKGMANFEATSDRSLDVPIVHILRTKCVPVATAMGVPTDINVVKMVRPRK